MMKINEEIQKEITSSSKQLQQLKMIARDTWNASRRFDIDLGSTNKTSPFDKMVKDNVLQKSLENDNLIVVEGCHDSAPDWFTKDQLELEVAQIEKAISNGDFEQDLDDKIEMIQKKNVPKLGFFEKRQYFESVFPSLKIQKPGYDLYGSSTVFLTILAVYVFVGYSSISVDQASLLDSVKSSNNIFKGEMAVTLIIVIIIIIIERYVSRSDTKAVDKKQMETPDKNKKGFFQESDFFKRSST
jgi:hypothetical protein